MTVTQAFKAGLFFCGVLLAPVAAQAQQLTTAEAKKAADEAYTRQREYLLHNDWPNLQRYAGANQRLPAPKAGTPRVVLLGNSITEGWPKADSAFFAGKPYGYIGRGISGQTSGQTLLRFRQDVIDLRPAVVVLLIGTNDVAENNGPYNPQNTLNNIMSMVELAQAHRIRVVLCSVPPAADFWWRKGLNTAPKIVALNQQIKAYAAKTGCVYLDYHTALADEQQGLKKCTAKTAYTPTWPATA
ncbi:GDSL-type esterase/lipase family protein [Hymenobacter humi]|uniref:GDSL-type esterase/lipase family protein n=1 Tax=Hymenobacter humi TaxID=1411620 RepID=A0ABW2U7T0_9BACT